MSDWAALLTPRLPGAVAVWGLKGMGAWNRVAPSLQAAKGPCFNHERIPERARLARWNLLARCHGDEVLVIPRCAEPIPWFEIHGHSGPELVRTQEEWLATRGFRMANPESFSAWNETDLLAAETAHALSRTLTRRGVEGVLEHSSLCRKTLTECARHLESGQPEQAAESLANMAAGYGLAKGWTTGWKVALCGPPNAGKSSLLNALVGTHRAIVSELPGTTRDVVRARTVLDGWVVEFMDTAGWRESEDSLESAGIRLGMGVVEKADLILVISEDAPRELIPQDSACFPNAIAVWTKSDLQEPCLTGPAHALQVSSLSGKGVGELSQQIVDNLTGHGSLPQGPAAFSVGLRESLMRAAGELASGNFKEAAGIVRGWLNPVGNPVELTIK